MKILIRNAFCLGLLATCLFGQSAYGATFEVNSKADDHDAKPGDRRCATAAGECTLRAAIEEATAARGANTITFRLSPGSSIVLQNGQLEIGNAGALKIDGPGAAALAVDGNGATRLFFVDAGATATFSGLTLRRGFVQESYQGKQEFGGGVANLGWLTLTNVVISDNSAADGGGGILNQGRLSLIQSTVTGNSATNFAGGILNSGMLNLKDSTVSNNDAPGGCGGIDNRDTATLTGTTISGNTSTNHAGGLTNRGTLSLINSTVSGNRGLAGVGGIENFGTLNLFSSTVSGNSSDVSGGVFGARGRIIVVDSIIAGNFGPSGPSDPNADCTLSPLSTFDSRGHDLFGQGTGCMPGPRDVTAGSDAVSNFLGPLEDNGGPTLTQALLAVPDNPAVDGGDPAGCRDPQGRLLTTDQGGQPRRSPAAGRCDIGAYELQSTPSFGNLSSSSQSSLMSSTSIATAAAVVSSISYVGRVASATSATSSTKATLTASRQVATGDALLVAVLLTSTSSRTGAVSVTDGAGNVYTIDRDQNDAGDGDRVLVLSAKNVRSLPAGGTITLTFPTSAGYHVSVDEFTGLVGLDRTSSAWAKGSSFSSGSTSATSQPVELLFGVVGNESGAAPTWSAGWTGLPTLSVSTDRLGAAYQVSSSTGQFAASGSITGTWMAAIATYTSGTSGPPPDNPPTASLSVTQVSSPALTVTADASGSTDIDATPIASYRFDFGDGTPAVATSPPTATAQHTYAAAGTYVVTLTVTDTGGNTSAPTTASFTVSPADIAPTASLSVTQVSSPALTVTADASGSMDIDATPIASYRFDFGDGTPVVATSPPTATAQHTYAAAGIRTVTLTVTDTAGKTSLPATATVTVSATSGPQIMVYAGYYDTHHSHNTKAKPNPWQGSPGVLFVGKSDSTSGGWDTAAVRIDNLTGGSLAGVVVTVDVGSKHYALWGTNTIPVGGTLILAQTASANFDLSDNNPAGCPNCDPAKCTSAVVTAIPVVHVTVGGQTVDFSDTGQILNTHGVDSAGCPYTATRNDESEDWQRIG